MSQGFPAYPPYAPPPQKKSNTALIVGAVIAGGLLLTMLVCCGMAARFLQSPVASAAAKEPFELASVPVPEFRSLGDPTPSPEPITFQHFSVQGEPGTPGATGQIWVYRPNKNPDPKSLPCVLIAGAGSTLMEGMTLGEGDQHEHWPYANEGFVVVAYDLDGGESSGNEAQRYAAFKDSRAGLINARNALEFVIRELPEVDPQKIFAAGHSSAASHALLFAEHEPRLAGVAAYAPCVNIPERLPGFVVRALETQMPGLVDFLTQSSPHTHEARIACPVFLFGAADDDNTPLAETKKFGERLRSLGKDVTIETTATGGHYESMINDGIPRGIAWMKAKSQ